MKLRQISEATHDGFVYIEAWDDDGQTLYRMSIADAKQLKSLSISSDYTDIELLDKIIEIFHRAEKIIPDAVWDWFNFEFKRER